MIDLTAFVGSWFGDDGRRAPRATRQFDDASSTGIGEEIGGCGQGDDNNRASSQHSARWASLWPGLRGRSVSTVNFFENVGQRIELDVADSSFNY